MKSIKMRSKVLFTSFLMLWSLLSIAQENLSKDDAVTIALEHNYNIKVVNNNVKMAENSASIYNSGYLPTLTASGGANYSDKDSENEFQDGRVINQSSTSKTINASTGLNYLIFDGLGRRYNYKKLKELYNLSEIQAQQVIENTVLQLLTAYYEVARLTQNQVYQKNSLSISKERLQREKYKYQYGQSTQLDMLNSEVDVNNDSINLLNINREVANAKRNLNLILGREIQKDFKVDTTVIYAIDLTLPKVLASAKKRNKVLQQAEKNIELSNFDLKINRSGWYPSIGINGGYSWNNLHTDSDVANPFALAANTSKGFQTGLSLSWNIFDGGKTKTRVQNAKIALDNNEILKEKIEQELERNVSNAWETYQNALFVLQAEKKNMETNKRNFERSSEQFKLGQIISVEFRVAQINYLNSVTNFNKAKYLAKIAELNLLQLSGQLLGATY
ncbi:MAG: TolC family protein [Flavobacteriia bacterium]|nr:MAG: TolC family protein [Flavobacteriia bacterium]